MAKKRFNKTKLLIPALVVIILGSLLAWWLISRSPAQPAPAVTDLNNGLSTPASSPTKPSTKKSSNSNSGSSAQGGAIDKHGQSSGCTNSSDWQTSSGGLITLHCPANNSTLKPGDYISGTSKLSSVEYRLVDDQVGVLAQGSLSVVGGKFSGVLQYKPQSSTGHLDIFSFNSSGAEINRIEVQLKLNG